MILIFVLLPGGLCPPVLSSRSWPVFHPKIGSVSAVTRLDMAGPIQWKEQGLSAHKS